jgi:hypothetical protein
MIIGQISKQQAGVEFRQRIDRKNAKFLDQVKTKL